MENVDNSGVGTSGFSTVTLKGILDPENKHPEMLQTLAGIPDEILDNIIFLCAGYDQQEIEFIAKVASGTSLSCQLDSGPKNGGILHHAAVIAPIVSVFGQEQFPAKTLERFIGMLIEDLTKYWKCGPEDFQFDSKNRFLFARGAALCFLVTEGDARPCWRNDSKFIWVGSKFEDLRDCAEEILNSCSIDGDWLEELSMCWVPNSAITDDGTLDPNFEEANQDRLKGCSGPPSILTEKEWEIVDEFVDEPPFIMGPLAFPRWYLACLTYFTGELREDIPFISTLLVLADGLEEGEFEAGESALMMMDFSLETLRAIEELSFKYGNESRGLIIDVISREAGYPDPEGNEMVQSLVKFVSATAPLMDAYIAIDEDGDDDFTEDEIDLLESPVDITDEKSEAHLKVNESYYEFLERVDDCFMWFTAAVAMEGYELNESNYADIARGLTACHLIGCNSIEDSTESTIVNLGRHMDQIVEHSDDLVLTRDLSREGLKKLY